MSSDNNFANLSHVAAFILLSFNNLVNLCKISREYLQRYHQLVGVVHPMLTMSNNTLYASNVLQWLAKSIHHDRMLSDDFQAPTKSQSSLSLALSIWKREQQSLISPNWLISKKFATFLKREVAKWLESKYWPDLVQCDTVFTWQWSVSLIVLMISHETRHAAVVTTQTLHAAVDTPWILPTCLWSLRLSAN